MSVVLCWCKNSFTCSMSEGAVAVEAGVLLNDWCSIQRPCLFCSTSVQGSLCIHAVETTVVGRLTAETKYHGGGVWWWGASCRDSATSTQFITHSFGCNTHHWRKLFYESSQVIHSWSTKVITHQLHMMTFI